MKTWASCLCCWWCCDGSIVSDEELAMRNKVTTAARTNDLEGLKKALSAIKDKYNDPEKTNAACNMWDPERPGVVFMTALKWAAEHGNIEMCELLLENGAVCIVICTLIQVIGGNSSRLAESNLSAKQQLQGKQPAPSFSSGPALTPTTGMLMGTLLQTWRANLA